MKLPLPQCDHRGKTDVENMYICSSSKIVSKQKLVPEHWCMQCPFAEVNGEIQPVEKTRILIPPEQAKARQKVCDTCEWLKDCWSCNRKVKVCNHPERTSDIRRDMLHIGAYECPLKLWE